MAPSRTAYTTWNEKVDVDILAAVLDVWKPSSKDFAQVLEVLRKENYTFSESALRYIICPKEENLP
jgi:hypothetical protein